MAVLIADGLRRLREHRGWSYRDLSARTGISVAMLNRVERGLSTPTIEVLGRWLKAYDLGFGWIDGCEHDWEMTCRLCGTAQVAP